MIVFPGKDAEKMFADTFHSSNFASFQGCYSGIQMRQHLLAVTAWCSNSKTAKMVLQAVHDSPKELYLVGMKGGYQAFNNEETNAVTGKKLAVAFVDLDAKLGIRVRGPHNEYEQPTSIPQKIALHNNIAFLHELGHAIQWFYNPGFFAGLHQWSSRFAGDIKNAAIKRGTKGDANVPVMAGKGAIAQVKYNKAMTAYVANHPVFGGIENPGPKGWPVRIEVDNMFRHEWPVCQEMKVPRRLNYRDICLMGE